MVTYTKKVTNPGTVALSNVRVTDDKCGPVAYISGDTNADVRLDPSETWTYTCASRLTQTTTNTASAIGEANNLTARDFAIATVVVAAAVPITTVVPAVPKLPNTGVAPLESGPVWPIIVFSIFTVLLLLSVIVKKQKG